jgi:hypothetical protein
VVPQRQNNAVDIVTRLEGFGDLLLVGPPIVTPAHLRFPTDCLDNLLSSLCDSKRSSILHEKVTSARYIIREYCNDVIRIDEGTIYYRNKRHNFSFFSSLPLRIPA